jgi:hypothetical protein
MCQWSEKIGDSINYLILLEALVYERGLAYTKVGRGAHSPTIEAG